MKVFILLSIFVVAFANKCIENSHFEFCGTACPLTCDNYDNPPKFCNLMCKISCQCNEGYVKTSDGRRCVRPEECPGKEMGIPHLTKCVENAHFETCGTSCPLTCNNYNNPPKMCNLMCKIGCQCDKGYVKTSDGKRCVRPEQCPEEASVRQPVCGENQRFAECGSACPLTCENYQNPPKICPAMCVFGCECEKGYVKTKDGRCVLPEDCPANARVHEPNCVDKAEPGMCLAYFPSYYYNTETGECEKFIYGGCGGNGNRYRTKEECEQQCIVNAAPAACLEEKVTGPCKAYFLRFFHNKETGQCEEFVYGGCNGNSNNFNTKADCEGVCLAQSSKPTACLEEKVVGPCKAYMPRYFHNQETGQCERFIYGGCGGNSNNFVTQEDCEAVCLG